MLKLYYLFEKRKQKAVKLPAARENLPVTINTSGLSYLNIMKGL